MASDTRTLTAHCHCRRSTLSFTIPTSALPLPAHFCHCTICRTTHGTMATIHAPIPPASVDLSTFTSYAFSPKVNCYFCTTCGAHMFDKAKEEPAEQWYISVSLVDAEEDVWRFGPHNHLETTRDGGLAMWLPEVGGRQLGLWKRKRADNPGHAETGDWAPPASVQEADVENGEASAEKLHARCHCGGIDFYISRPRGPGAFKDMPENLTPKDKTKWCANIDVCESCRLLSSSFVTPWVFPPIDHITLADGGPYTTVFGTAKKYESSKGVTRTFCCTCGALVSYACEDRPSMVDIGVGLLGVEGTKGVRKEDWLEWSTNEISYEEDCRWPALLEGLKRGLRGV